MGEDEGEGEGEGVGGGEGKGEGEGEGEGKGECECECEREGEGEGEGEGVSPDRRRGQLIHLEIARDATRAPAAARLALTAATRCTAAAAARG